MLKKWWTHVHRRPVELRGQPISVWQQRRSVHSGWATSSGTQGLMQKWQVPEHNISLIHPTYAGEGQSNDVDANGNALRISRVGVGSPWLAESTATRMKAMKDAVSQGKSNFIQIDQSANMLRKSENEKVMEIKSAAIVLAELFHEGVVTREQCVISAVVDLADKLEDVGSMEIRIKNLLTALDLEVIDVLIIRLTSQVFSSWAENSSRDKLGDLLDALQIEANKGRIQSFGFAIPELIAVDNHFLDLYINSISRYPNFRMIQFPLNINIVSNLHLVEFARENRLFSIAERPLDTLNAQGKPVRLVDYRTLNGHEVAQSLQSAFNFALQLEKRYMDDIMGDEITGFVKDENELPACSEVGWAHILAQSHARFTSYPEWTFIREHQIVPAVMATLKKLGNHEKSKEFAVAYMVAIRELLEKFSDSVELEAADESSRISRELSILFPELCTSSRLQEKILRLLLSTSISCIVTEDESRTRSDILQQLLLPPQTIKSTLSTYNFKI